MSPSVLTLITGGFRELGVTVHAITSPVILSLVYYSLNIASAGLFTRIKMLDMIHPCYFSWLSGQQHRNARRLLSILLSYSGI